MEHEQKITPQPPQSPPEGEESVEPLEIPKQDQVWDEDWDPKDGQPGEWD